MILELLAYIDIIAFSLGLAGLTIAVVGWNILEGMYDGKEGT